MSESFDCDDDPVLPELTRDETDGGWGEAPDAEPDELERHLREKPPHYDD